MSPRKKRPKCPTKEKKWENEKKEEVRSSVMGLAHYWLIARTQAHGRISQSRTHLSISKINDSSIASSSHPHSGFLPPLTAQGLAGCRRFSQLTAGVGLSSCRRWPVLLLPSARLWLCDFSISSIIVLSVFQQYLYNHPSPISGYRVHDC